MKRLFENRDQNILVEIEIHKQLYSYLIEHNK